MSQKDIVKNKTKPNTPARVLGFFFLVVCFGVGGLGFFLWVLLPTFKVIVFPTEWCWDGCLPTFFFVSPWSDSYLWVKLEFTHPGMDAVRVVVGFRSTYCLSSVIHPQRFHHIPLKGTSDLVLQRSSIFSALLLQELFLIQVPNSLPSFLFLFLVIFLYNLCFVSHSISLWVNVWAQSVVALRSSSPCLVLRKQFWLGGRRSTQ